MKPSAEAGTTAPSPCLASALRVLEIADDHDGDTYRAVYTARFAKRLYVLHVFQKKSRRGVSTPQFDLRLIQTRLRQAEQEERAHQQAEQDRQP